MMRSIFNPGWAKISLNASSPALTAETSANRLPARTVIDTSLQRIIAYIVQRIIAPGLSQVPQLQQIWKTGEVPCLRIDTMTAEEKRAHVIADNEIALNAGWREELLAMKRKLLSSTWLAWIGSDISTRRSGLPSARTSNSGTSLFGPTTMAVSARSIDPVMSSSLPSRIGRPP
jgi:hypothetical protein